MVARMSFSPYNAAFDRFLAVMGIAVLSSKNMKLFYREATTVLEAFYNEKSQLFCDFENSFSMPTKLLTDVQWSHPQKKAYRAPNAVASGSKHHFFILMFPCFSSLYF